MRAAEAVWRGLRRTARRGVVGGGTDVDKAGAER
jgi:hypothetical protein